MLNLINIAPVFAVLIEPLLGDEKYKETTN